MSKLNTQQRKDLALSDFGDPGRRLFPIVDQDDVDSAAHLIGKAKNPDAVKKRIISIAKRKGLKVPDAWKGSTVKATFDLQDTSRRVEGEYAIYPNSKLWVAGDYPDKRYDMTPEENWAAVEIFAPVWGNIEHTDFLQGRACEVRSIRLDDDDPTWMLGEVAVPLALDGLLVDKERRLSCEWDRDTKQLSGLALTTNPRIPEAALMAAFSGTEFARTRHDTRAGQSAMQSIHNATVQAGAVCSQAAKMASRHEASTIQSIHDMTMEHGATCDDGTPANGVYAYYGSDKGKTMDKKNTSRNKVLAWLLGADDETEDAGDEVVDFATTIAAAQADKKSSKATSAAEAKFAADLETERQANAALRAEYDKERSARITESAAAFATTMISQGRATASEQEAIIDAYARAAQTDASSTVTFADGAKVGMLDAVKKLLESRPAKYATLFSEQVATESADTQDKTKIALVAHETTEGGTVVALDAARRKALLDKTPVGRSAAKTATVN